MAEEEGLIAEEQDGSHKQRGCRDQVLSGKSWSGHFAPQSVTVGRDGRVTSAVGSLSEVCAILVQSSV